MQCLGLSPLRMRFLRSDKLDTRPVSTACRSFERKTYAKVATDRSRSRKLDVKPKKSFSQNFLINDEVSAEIAKLAKLSAGDRVIEIGPGTGSLTRNLLRYQARVVAIEADTDVAAVFQENFKEEMSSGNLQLVMGDATRLDLRKMLQNYSDAESGYKVVSNLPFNITTEMLKILLPMGDLIQEVFVMLQANLLPTFPVGDVSRGAIDMHLPFQRQNQYVVQLEAAQRLSGVLPDNSDYRAMSVLVEFYSSTTLGMQISRTSFEPQPNVDCAVVHFKLKGAKERLSVPSEQAFVQLVSICFSSRRKTVKNNLKAVFTPEVIDTALGNLGLKLSVRPQEMTVEDFAALSRMLMS